MWGLSPLVAPHRADPGQGVFYLLEQGLGVGEQQGGHSESGCPATATRPTALPSTTLLQSALPSLASAPPGQR